MAKLYKDKNNASSRKRSRKNAKKVIDFLNQFSDQSQGDKQ